MQDAKLSRAIALSVAEGGLATVMGSLIGGVFLTGFALAMGANQLQIGILAGLPVLANFAQLLGAFIIERTGSCKQMCVRTTIASRLLWLPAVLIPLWLFPERNGDAVWLIIVAIGTSNILGSLGGMGWLAWTKELIPASQRVRFFGKRNLCNTGLSLSASLVGACFLDWSNSRSAESVTGFLTVFAMASACGIVGWWLLSRIPEPASTHEASPPMHERWLAPLQDPNYRALVAFYACWNLSVHIAQPFFAVYMLEKLHLPFLWVTGLATLSSVAGLATNNLWSRLCERFGTKPIVLIATCLDLAIPLCWLFVGPEWIGLLLLIHCLGILNAPIAMGPNNLLLGIAPTKNASPYLAIFNASVGTMTALAGVCGGTLATIFAGNEWQLGPIAFDGLKTIFLISLVGRLASLLLLSGVHEANSEPVIFVLQSFRRTRIAAPAQVETPSGKAA